MMQAPLRWHRKTVPWQWKPRLPNGSLGTVTLPWGGLPQPAVARALDLGPQYDTQKSPVAWGWAHRTILQVQFRAETRLGCIIVLVFLFGRELTRCDISAPSRRWTVGAHRSAPRSNALPRLVQIRGQTKRPCSMAGAIAARNFSGRSQQVGTPKDEPQC